MQFRIIKCLVLICTFVLAALFNAQTTEAASPAVNGRVIMSGTNTPVSNIWVRWRDDDGAVRYVRTDSNGRYTFPDLSGIGKKEGEDMLNNRIDTNGDGAGDAYEVTLGGDDDDDKNEWKDIDKYFSSDSNPHNFTAIVPAAWSGSFNTINGVNINSASATQTIGDLIFTPSATQATPTPGGPGIYTISGIVFEDLDRDGVQGPTEIAYSDVTITLGGDRFGTATSASPSGSYQFTNLNTGNYTVAITLPPGYSSTTPTGTNVVIGTDQTIHFGIAPGTGGGALCTAVIQGQVFNDSDGNGNLNTGEPGLNNWDVTLSGAALSAPIVKQSSSTGAYSFTNLCQGTYTLSITVNDPYVSTNAVSRTLTVNDGQTYSGNRFGARAIYSLNGTVFVDTNNNQVQDGGELSRSGLRIFVSGRAFAQATTDANGNYSLPSLPAGSYQVSLSMPSGFGSTTANSLNINLNSDQALSFGIAPLDTLTIGGACNNNTAEIVLVIDHSLSMNSNDPSTNIPKMDAAIDAANVFVDVIERNAPTAKIGVIQFSESEDYPNRPDQSGVLSPLSTDYSLARNAINSITTVGGTCIHCGVDLAANLLRASNSPTTQKIVVFMTDGIANQATYSNGTDMDEEDAENEAMYAIIDAVNEQNIIFHTVGVGSGSSRNIDEVFLTQMANTNGGRYFNNPNDGDMVDIYTEIANTAVASGGITGVAYNDKNLNRTRDPGEEGVPNLRVELEGASLVNKLTYLTDSNGNYAFYGLCDGVYNVTEFPTPPWNLTTPATHSNVNVAMANISANYNFGNRYGYNITGSVFNDINKNRLRDAGDEAYTGGIDISIPSGDLTINQNDGTFKVEGLMPGSYLVSYTSPIPSGYNLIYPRNGPPPSFLVTVGPTCSVDRTTGAQCVNGDVNDLHFSISNSIPWYQTYNGNIRIDNGFTNVIPLAPLSPKYMAITDAGSQNPGVIYIGNGTANYGHGSASTSYNVVGGSLYPEVYPGGTGSALKTEYSALLSKAQRAGVDVIAINTINGCSTANCTLPADLPPGVYQAGTDLNLNNVSLAGGGDYVFLINGTLTIRGAIQIAQGTTAVFSARNDISVLRNVSAVADAYPVPDAQLQGIFIAGRNFVIQGINDCVVGQDYMLNVAGSIVVNAGRTGGSFINNRDLCGDNPSYPSFTIQPRLDFFLQAPEFIMTQQLMSQEVAP